MKNNLPELSAAEWVIMKKVWELKKTNVREIYEELKPSRNWAYSTVRTMTDRLREKGYLIAKKVGNTYFYQPSVSRRKVAFSALESFADKVFDGAIGPVVSHLIKQDKLSDVETEEIKRLLEED
ncbi:BlaI/MecI/CopY family transcriptional regulator [Candidatus Hydrogenedentota bacterium]